ncbi:hypothetical protein [Catenovulum adriaticum]|uniref:Uncharacterized protein n=1 Tax=Catenovulum adriaticum TaxID=2984846 RepID=A0ABY7AQ49_9ALTE|nr:hypothetical protein [Catenovulum sp. TS8]WAJ71445.1 hypothetical protein OLW01_06515 [Catenovulum sp. TS8]
MPKAIPQTKYNDIVSRILDTMVSGNELLPIDFLRLKKQISDIPVSEDKECLMAMLHIWNGDLSSADCFFKKAQRISGGVRVVNAGNYISALKLGNAHLKAHDLAFSIATTNGYASLLIESLKSCIETFDMEKAKFILEQCEFFEGDSRNEEFDVYKEIYEYVSAALTSLNLSFEQLKTATHESISYMESKNIKFIGSGMNIIDSELIDLHFTSCDQDFDCIDANMDLMDHLLEILDDDSIAKIATRITRISVPDAQREIREVACVY